MLGAVLRTESVWEREISADNLLFILILNNFPEHVRTHILYHGLHNLKQIPFLSKILNYTIRDWEISNKMLGTVLRTFSVWDREILADNMLFIQNLNNFSEHVRTHILCHCLC